jgi:hypothetical protein
MQTVDKSRCLVESNGVGRESEIIFSIFLINHIKNV